MLFSKTSRLSGDIDLYALAHSRNPVTWFDSESDYGMVALGEIASIRPSGINRFIEARKWFDELLDEAVIDQEYTFPGAGVTAFASFSFSDTSDASYVVVPKFVFIRNEQGSFVTQISTNPIISRLDSAQVKLLNNPVGDFPPLKFKEGAITAARYGQLVTFANQQIAIDQLDKIVLARDKYADIPEGTNPDVRVILRKLHEQQKNARIFSIDGFLGASPEPIIEIEDGKYRAKVLAGTQDKPDGVSSMAGNLLEDKKSVLEHLYSVRNYVGSIRPLVPSCIVSEPYLLELSSLVHVATDIHGETGGVHPLDLLSAVHPTAAIAGTPTRLAKQLIPEFEGTDRRRYAGPTGWFNNFGNSEFVISIRSAQITGSEVRAFAGAGLVAGSDPQKEIAETEAKFQTIEKAFS